MKILIQGAMEEEIQHFLEVYNPYKIEQIAGFKFYIANYKQHTIIVSLSEKGIINTTTATTIGINTFAPDLVINQGCAGAHTKDLNIGDIIIGEKSIHINDFHTPIKYEGEGSNSLEWSPSSKRSYSVNSTPHYVNLALKTQTNHKKIVGALGSGDMFSREYDRIVHLNKLFGELCEDMESVASLKACERFSVDRIALRIISNNELTSQKFNRDVCYDIQKFTISFIDTIISSIT
ncbi:MAG: 5'-methylthioadenosine/S-adenosylhomocysteine nucleosidase [Clostridia bacterium]|nr:5'-methylthioadenosine/S-adenosylhomocysteine nucleosidase [Clostridia bacterium]